jgi:exonuclease VII small subunit
MDGNKSDSNESSTFKEKMKELDNCVQKLVFY